MDGPPRRVASLALALAVAVAVGAAGCSGATERTFAASAAGLDITVIDRTGHLQAISTDTITDPPAFETAAINPPGRPDVLIVGWTTRRCGHSTLTLEPAGDRLSITIRTPLDPACIEDVAKPRGIRLVFDRRIDAATVDVVEIEAG
jgi:hypothetical protein